MWLDDRIRKLEQTDNGDDLAMIIASFIGVGPVTVDGALAVISGSDLGPIQMAEGETSEDFVRRVYAVKSGAKQFEQMTHTECQSALRQADAMIEQEKKK